MRIAKFIMILFLAVCMSVPAWAQSSVERARVLEIIEKLTSTGRQSWIPAGTIEARHQEYKAPETTNAAVIDRAIEQAVSEYQNAADKAERSAELQKMHLDAIPFNVRYELSNEMSMTSSVVVRYDGYRFHWEVAVSSRSDSVRPSADLAGNYTVKYFNRSWNDRRIFAWDGQKYTIYAVSAGGAIVDASDRMPRAVTGPLTAGFIPWGSGPLSYASLIAAKISATEIARDGITQIEMTVEQSNGSYMSFVLDPSKDFAVTSATLPGANNTVVSNDYSGYRNFGGYWIPKSVLVEHHDLLTNRLLRSDKWDFTTVSTSVPGPEKFNVALGANTVVEYYSTMATKASVYHYSNAVDTELLLAERLAYAAGEGIEPQNCATASLQYAATQMGKTPTVNQLRQMVGADGQTTMYDLKQAARSLGLHSRVVQTDVATLETLSGCKAILHLPNQNHFVVLDQIDGRYAWTVDLSKDAFYCRKDKGFIAGDWSDGIALLISDRPIEGPFADVPDSVLRGITGGAGWSCTQLLQNEYVLPCEGQGYTCYGYFQWYYERWGCEQAASGDCSHQQLALMAGSDCYWDPIGRCRVTGIWDWYSISACN